MDVTRTPTPGQEFTEKVCDNGASPPNAQTPASIQEAKFKPADLKVFAASVNSIFVNNPIDRNSCKTYSNGTITICNSLTNPQVSILMDPSPIYPTVKVSDEYSTIEYVCHLKDPEAYAPKASPVPEEPSLKNFFGFFGRDTSVKMPQTGIECSGSNGRGQYLTLTQEEKVVKSATGVASVVKTYVETLSDEKEGIFKSREVIPGEPLKLHEEFFATELSPQANSLKSLAQVIFPGILTAGCVMMAVKDWRQALGSSQKPLKIDGEEVDQPQSSRLGAALAAVAWTATGVALGCLTFATYNKNSNPLHHL